MGAFCWIGLVSSLFQRCRCAERSPAHPRLQCHCERLRSVIRPGLVFILYRPRLQSGGRTDFKCQAAKSHRVFLRSSRRSCGNIGGISRVDGMVVCRSGHGLYSYHIRFATSSCTSLVPRMSRPTSEPKLGGETTRGSSRLMASTVVIVCQDRSLSFCGEISCIHDLRIVIPQVVR